MKIERGLADFLKKNLASTKKIIVLYGPRQVGKTTLVNEILENSQYKFFRVNFDEVKNIDIFSSRDWEKIQLFIKGYDCIFMDEAQRCRDIGINLKIIHENQPNLKIIVTGSSSLDLTHNTKEPLTGRTNSCLLYPVSYQELANHFGIFHAHNRLEEFMIYGMYPELFSLENKEEKSSYLRELANSYL